MMQMNNSLSQQLGQIGLRALPAQLDDFLARAAKARWSPHQLLEELARAETAERSRRSFGAEAASQRHQELQTHGGF
jgi:hypothetical protein